MIPLLKVDGKSVILDPHHFRGTGWVETKRDRIERERDVEKWGAFMEQYGDEAYIILVTNHTKKEVEERTGSSCDSVCHEVWYVEERRDPSVIMQSARALLNKVDAESDGYDYSSSPGREMYRLLRIDS